MAIFNLSDYFRGVGAKYLTAVEADPKSSNQHEIQGVSALREIFGEGRQEDLKTQFLYLGRDENDVWTDTGFLTWYDAREKKPDRSPEYRLYYPSTSVSEKMKAGDLLVIGLRTDGSVMIVVAQPGAAVESQIRWLFSLAPEPQHALFAMNPIMAEKDREIGFAARAILSELNIEIGLDKEDWLEQLLKSFGGKFPSTNAFSAFARKTHPQRLSARDDPDAALLLWHEHEEMLFKTLEQHIVAQRLEQGFDNVEDFSQFSLSFHNRRKSRAGHALENQVEQVMKEQDVTYTRGGRTEGKSKPDFIFPGIDDYRNPVFPDSCLTMLGVKSTCKDRWRQVLQEASRVDTKHLLTLEPAISLDQTKEMKSRTLQLILPHELHETFLPEQQAWLWGMKQFLEFVRERQERRG